MIVLVVRRWKVDGVKKRKEMGRVENRFFVRIFRLFLRKSIFTGYFNFRIIWMKIRKIISKILIIYFKNGFRIYDSFLQKNIFWDCFWWAFYWAWLVRALFCAPLFFWSLLHLIIILKIKRGITASGRARGRPVWQTQWYFLWR